jgi:hypothetical protein
MDHRGAEETQLLKGHLGLCGCSRDFRGGGGKDSDGRRRGSGCGRRTSRCDPQIARGSLELLKVSDHRHHNDPLPIFQISSIKCLLLNKGVLNKDKIRIRRCIISFMFYRKFWPVIKTNLLALFKGFEKVCSNIVRLNYDMITLIPKEEEARNLNKFKPISLINYNFKIFAKAMNNRLIQICDRLLSCN